MATPDGYGYPRQNPRRHNDDRREVLVAYASHNSSNDINQRGQSTPPVSSDASYTNGPRYDDNEHGQTTSSVSSAYGGFANNPRDDVDEPEQRTSSSGEYAHTRNTIPREVGDPSVPSGYTGRSRPNPGHIVKDFVNPLLNEIIQNDFPIYLIHIPKMKLVHRSGMTQYIKQAVIDEILEDKDLCESLESGPLSEFDAEEMKDIIVKMMKFAIYSLTGGLTMANQPSKRL